MINYTQYQQALLPLLKMALNSPGLLSPNDFNMSRYSLKQSTRNRLIDPDISALEDYLIDNSQLPAQTANDALLYAFGDSIHSLCHDPATPLQIGYHRLAWLLAWLNQHYPPAFFGGDPDSPLQVLQMAAALGIGEWAAVYNQIEDGVSDLMTLAKSSLGRVRGAAALGLQRMLRGAWDRTVRRLRLRVMIANAQEWPALLIAISDPAALQAAPAAQFKRLLDALEFHQQALRFWAEAPGDLEAEKTLLALTLARVIQVQPALGLSQVAAWGAWPQPQVKALLAAGLAPLPADPAVAEIQARLQAG